MSLKIFEVALHLPQSAQELTISSDSKRQRLALGEISGSIRETQLQIIRDDDEEQESM